MRRICFALTVGSVFLLVGVTSAQKQPNNNNIVPATAVICTAVPNAVANCNFGAGFASWTVSGDCGVFCNPVGGCGPFADSCASLGPVNHPGLLTQVVPAAAGPHDISFWVSNSGQPSEFEVWWEGQKIHEVKTIPNHAYTQYTLPGVMASGAGSDLTFAFTNLPSFVNLSDIVVTP